MQMYLNPKPLPISVPIPICTGLALTALLCRAHGAHGLRFRVVVSRATRVPPFLPYESPETSGCPSRQNEHLQRSGLLEQDMAEAVTSLALAGLRAWVGLASGTIRVYGDTGAAALREWRAHAGAVVAITVAGSRVYTLGSDGSLYGWSSNVPSLHDTDARYPASPISLVASAVVPSTSPWSICFQILCLVPFSSSSCQHSAPPFVVCICAFRLGLLAHARAPV